MKKTLLTLLLLSGSAQAATTISTTLTMTSPSAVISMTGVSATAFLNNISSTSMNLAGVSITAWPFTKCTAFNNISIPGSSSSTALTHGLGVTPTFVVPYLQNTIANLGYIPGEIANTGSTNAGSLGFTVVNNSISTTIIWGVAPVVLRKSDGAATSITVADWVLGLKECTP